MNSLSLRMRLGKLSVIVATLILLPLLGLAIHEGGHAIFAVLSGQRITRLLVLPGIQLYPQFTITEWGGWVARISFTTKDLTPTQNGLIMLMGSGSTALCGYLAFGFYLWMRPRRWAGLILKLAAIFYPWDLISYSLFPLLGLRHWILFGGKTPEPLIGALKLGLAPGTIILILLVHTTLSVSIVAKMAKDSQAKN